jgi:hypothetical protein
MIKNKISETIPLIARILEVRLMLNNLFLVSPDRVNENPFTTVRSSGESFS